MQVKELHIPTHSNNQSAVNINSRAGYYIKATATKKNVRVYSLHLWGALKRRDYKCHAFKRKQNVFMCRQTADATICTKGNN
jgi:hypothetical protein